MPLSFFTNFAGQKHNGSLVLLVDIGSSSVGAALVNIEKGHAPNVVASVRENISFQEVLLSHRFLSSMNHALDKALKSVQLKAKSSGGISHAFCTLSSPWFILKTRNLHVSHAEEFEITNQMVDDLIHEDTELLKEELKETLPPKDMRVIEKKIIQMKLNGYEIKNPYGQKTSRVELSTTIGVSSGNAIESIERKLRNFFHIKSVHFGVFPVAAFSVIRDIFPNEKNFLFLDITGEATDVSLVNNDILVGTTSFSRGKNFFIREISTKLNTIHEEAATLFSMFLRGELDNERNAQVENIIAHAESEWLVRFKKGTDTLSRSGVLPSKIFFTTDTDVSPLFATLMSSGNGPLSGGGQHDVQYLDQAIVANFVSFDTAVTRDPFVVIEALLAEKIIGQHT